MDLPLYTTATKSELSDLGSANYRLFDCGIVLKQVLRQESLDFKELLMRLRNGESSNSSTTSHMVVLYLPMLETPAYLKIGLGSYNSQVPRYDIRQSCH